MTTPNRPLIGAHCSGGVGKALARATEIGAECLQVFASAPGMWRDPKHADADVTAFVEGCRTAGLGPVFLHGVYLLNLASAIEINVARSIQSINAHLNAADRLGADGLVIHVGSAGNEVYEVAEDRVVAGLGLVLEINKGASKLLLETCAGQGATIGRTFGELGRIIERLDGHPRLGVCLDTCHVFAAGCALETDEDVDRMLAELDAEIGLERLACIHANDSRAPRGSNVDRHAIICAGYLGEAPFARLLARPELENVPFILEVPGEDGEGPDRPNIDALKRLRSGGVAAVREIPPEQKTLLAPKQRR